MSQERFLITYTFDGVLRDLEQRIGVKALKEFVVGSQLAHEMDRLDVYVLEDDSPLKVATFYGDGDGLDDLGHITEGMWRAADLFGKAVQDG